MFLPQASSTAEEDSPLRAYLIDKMFGVPFFILFYIGSVSPSVVREHRKIRGGGGRNNNKASFSSATDSAATSTVASSTSDDKPPAEDGAPAGNDECELETVRMYVFSNSELERILF